MRPASRLRFLRVLSIFNSTKRIPPIDQTHGAFFRSESQSKRNIDTLGSFVHEAERVPPALPSWITRPCHIPPNRTRRSTIYISWRKKSGGGKIQAFQIDVPQFGAPTLVVRARNRRKSTRLWPVSSPSFIPLENWSRRVSLSLSISRLLKFMVSTRMIRGRSNPLVRTRFHYAKSKENYKRSGYNWTAYGRRMKKRLNLR